MDDDDADDDEFCCCCLRVVDLDWIGNQSGNGWAVFSLSSSFLSLYNKTHCLFFFCDFVRIPLMRSK